MVGVGTAPPFAPASSKRTVRMGDRGVRHDGSIEDEVGAGATNRLRSVLRGLAPPCRWLRDAGQRGARRRGDRPPRAHREPSHRRRTQPVCAQRSAPLGPLRTLRQRPRGGDRRAAHHCRRWSRRCGRGRHAGGDVLSVCREEPKAAVLPCRCDLCLRVPVSREGVRGAEPLRPAPAPRRRLIRPRHYQGLCLG